MKPEIAVLPLEFWADVFIFNYKWITRREMAQFFNNIRDRKFSAKLQKLLHERGKHSLHYLDIYARQPDESTQKPDNIVVFQYTN